MRPGFDKDIFRDHSYRTGLVATNYEPQPVNLHFEYCVNDHYANGGTTKSFNRTVPASGTIVFPALEALLEAGFSTETVGEGSWRIDADRQAKVAIWSLQSDAQFRGWSCGQVAL
jgi:hypothetical protein